MRRTVLLLIAGVLLIAGAAATATLALRPFISRALIVVQQTAAERANGDVAAILREQQARIRSSDVRGVVTTKDKEGNVVYDYDEDGKPDAWQVNGQIRDFPVKPGSDLAPALITSGASLVSAIIGAAVALLAVRRTPSAKLRRRTVD